MLKLELSQTISLAAQPESGMGFQIVEVTTSDRRNERGIVYNADLFFFERERKEILATESYDRLVRTADNAGNQIQAIRVVRPTTITSTQRVMEHRAQKSGPAEGAPKEKTTLGETFKRFTAFVNDRRLRPDGSWSPGTYATTEEDARKVRSGREAVERYALPNPDPASQVFTGRPHANTSIQRGIVEPAFGHKGGGVEVIFPDGTQARTVTGPDKIPD